MKKIFWIVIATLLTLTCVFALASCGGKSDAPKKEGLETLVSVYHDGVYVGANEDFTVNLTTGETEKLIVADGKVGELTRFATLTVTPLSSSLFNNVYTYVLTGEKGEKTGELEKDVIGATFTAEIDGAESIGKITGAKIVAENILESDVPLTNKLEGALTWKEILKHAETTLSEQIKEESDTGALPREIYVKLVNAMASDDSPYYYYVSFIKSPSDYWALLMDPATGAVISKKV